MTFDQAMQMARQNGVDLVEVAPNADPPVCRLLDYGKLRYLYSKKERESKKTQKNTELREVRFRPNIGVHDLEAKLRKVKEFIEDGSKVKLTVRFPGAGSGAPAAWLVPAEAGGRRHERRSPPGKAAFDGRPGLVDDSDSQLAEGREGR